MRELYEFGPAEFVHLICGASLVITDSFHGIAFSINFGIPFVSFDRSDRLDDMSSRIDDILSRFGLEDRRFDEINDKNPLVFDSDRYLQRLNEERKCFLDFVGSV